MQAHNSAAPEAKQAPALTARLTLLQVLGFAIRILQEDKTPIAIAALPDGANNAPPQGEQLENKAKENPNKREQLIQLLQTLQQKKQKKDSTQKETVEALRTLMREEFMEKETAATKALCDLIFFIQILLARYWPNDQENGLPLDAITLEPIQAGEEALACVSGHVFAKSSLMEWYKTRGVKKHPVVTGIDLSLREVKYFQDSGISFEELIPVDPEAEEDPDDIFGEYFNNPILMHYRNRFSREPEMIGLVLGSTFAYIGLMAGIVSCLPFIGLSPVILFIFGGISLASGIAQGIQAYRENSPIWEGLFLGVFAGLSSCLAILVLSNLGQGVILLLSNYAWVTAASADAASSLWFSVQLALPILYSGYAFIKEFSQPGSMLDRHLSITGKIFGYPLGIGVAIGYELVLGVKKTCRFMLNLDANRQEERPQPLANMDIFLQLDAEPGPAAVLNVDEQEVKNVEEPAEKPKVAERPVTPGPSNSSLNLSRI